MEKILVAMNPEKPGSWAGVHALNLAKRIGASVSFLLILHPITGKPVKASVKKAEASMKKSIESFLEEGRTEGIKVDYYLAYGEYENTLINFINDNKITLLVVGPPSDQGRSQDSFTKFLEKIRHQVNCRIEVVQEKHLISVRNKGKGDEDVAPLSTNRRT